MLEILHQDSHILVLAKPPGLAVLPGGWGEPEPCLAGMLETQYGKVWVVHRLDKVTAWTRSPAG